MDEIPIPPRAIGKVGMVAQLQRVRQQDVGKLVAVRLPLGRMSSLTESLKPVFAWQVLVLGEPVDLNGKSCREIIVADPRLKPVSQLDPGDVDALAKRQAEQDADETLADLRWILAANPLTPQELDDFIDKAASASQRTCRQTSKREQLRTPSPTTLSRSYLRTPMASSSSTACSASRPAEEMLLLSALKLVECIAETAPR